MERRTPMQRVQGVLHKYPYLSPLIVLLIAVVVFFLLNERFLLPQNLSFITQQTVIVGTLAIAQTLVILTAGIDLSIGAVMVFSQMVMANLAVYATASNVLPVAGQSPVVAITIGIVAGVLAGALNGFLIVRFNLPPFIVTLGTLSIFSALTLILFKARTIQNAEMPEAMKFLGNTFTIGEFQLLYGVILMLILYGIFGYILRSTAWGMHIYAVGDDPNAAELSGISTKRVIFSVYVVSGLIIGIAAWVTIGRVGSASPNPDPLLNLDTITAVVIGGTSLFGGRGTLIGTLIGALIITVVQNGLSLAGLDQAYRVLAIGVLVIVAVAIDQWIRKVKA
ncbi:MAG: fructose transport system permease protein [Actinomycetota bacterium]|jgi:fructose transport system permease protein|nr:fructose transport system permease protein [Actinomycetota bacterium]